MKKNLAIEKRRRSGLAVCCIAMALTLFVTGCGSSNNLSRNADSPSAYAAAGETVWAAGDSATDSIAIAPSAETAGFANKALDSANVTVTATEQPRKLVKRGDISLETKEFDNALDSLIEIVEAAGGYVENQSVDGVSIRNKSSYYERSASLTARIPADKLDGVTSKLGSLCNILSQSESVSDISDNYYDAQSRLDMLKVKEERLISLLEQAEKLEDIIKLEDALTNCQYEIDSLTGQLRRMDSQVVYSTLSIQLNEVVEYSDVQPTPKTFGERFSDSLRRGGRNLLNSVQGFILNLVESGPATIFYLVIWGAFIWLVIWVIRRFGKRRKKAVMATAHTESITAPPTTPDADETTSGNSND